MKIRKLKASEIECRVAKVFNGSCSLLLYKTARVDRAILDEIHGDLWQNDFKTIDGKMYGGIGIYNQELKQWLWRWDCGTESNAEAEKGQASDCFKRAGFKWGIGIELYSAPTIFAKCDTVIEGNKYKLANKNLKFSVSEIEYQDEDITKLIIIDNYGTVVFTLNKKTPVPQKKKVVNKASDKVTSFVSKLKEAKLTTEQMQMFCSQYNISSKDEATIDNFLKNNDFSKCLNDFMKAS